MSDADAPKNDDSATVISAGGTGRTGMASGPARLPTSGSQAGAEAGVLPAGSMVGEFEITALVGQGGFGAVYEAWDHTLERVVAIKEYLPVSLSTRQNDGMVVPLSERHRETFDLGMRSFINEARLLAQFDHPSLLKVYRFWQERGTTYMVMPFYRGDTLRQALAAIPAGVDEGWLMRIMDGVTQALAVMHAANCYHRDIAPDNIILLEGSGRPVVLDFGAARRVITDKTQAITVILKPGYAPIEQYAEMPDMSQGAWTDVYALAAVMHVAICGRAPPPSVARLLSDSYAPLVDNEMLRQRYSVRLLSAIDAGLGVRPEARPQSMGALREALGLGEVATQHMGHGLTQGMQGASDRPPSTPPAPPARPRTASLPEGAGAGKLIATAAAVLLAIGAAGAWWWMQKKDGDAKVLPVVAEQDIKPGEPTQKGPPRPEPAVATPAALVARTPSESLASLASATTPGWDVAATPRKAEVTIGKDKLAFEVRSNKDGFVYTYLLSSSGEMFLLFPNLLDKRHKIVAGTPLQLPRPAWPMDSGGPAGINQFAVMVSEKERDFAATGLQNDGVFPQFPLAALAALELVRGQGPPPLAGKPVCATASPCNDVYGVGNFRIVEK